MSKYDASTQLLNEPWPWGIALFAFSWLDKEQLAPSVSSRGSRWTTRPSSS